MDVLSQILRTLKLHGSLYFRTDLRAPWGLEVPGEGRAVRFHVVVQGTCWLRVARTSQALLLTPGGRPRAGGAQRRTARDVC